MQMWTRFFTFNQRSLMTIPLSDFAKGKFCRIDTSTILQVTINHEHEDKLLNKSIDNNLFIDPNLT